MFSFQAGPGALIMATGIQDLNRTEFDRLNEIKGHLEIALLEKHFLRECQWAWAGRGGPVLQRRAGSAAIPGPVVGTGVAPHGRPHTAFACCSDSPSAAPRSPALVPPPSWGQWTVSQGRGETPWEIPRSSRLRRGVFQHLTQSSPPLFEGARVLGSFCSAYASRRGGQSGRLPVGRTCWYLGCGVGAASLDLPAAGVVTTRLQEAGPGRVCVRSW